MLYNDGPFKVDPQISIAQGGADPYTADATRFVTVTVAGTSQVASGISQRHAGRAGTGAVLRVGAANIGGFGGVVFDVDLTRTRVEWLESTARASWGTTASG